MRNTIIFIILVSHFALFNLNLLFAEQTKEESAIQAAKDWLFLVDEERYGESWETAASFFKNAVQKEQWITSMNAVRKPLGKLLVRKIKNSHYMTALPGAPDGEYVVIQFETSFENKKSSIETITPMLDKDGKWRTSGYYIK
jgi:hypothetical protein